MIDRGPVLGRRFVVPCLAIVGALVAQAAPAATVVVRVVERDGAALRGQPVDLVPVSTDAPFWGRLPRSATSDGEGQARFESLDPGRYRVRLGPIVDPAVVPPERNPYTGETLVTLDDDAAAAEVTIELWRGVPIAVEALSVDSDLPRGSVVVRHVETGFATTARFAGDSPSPVVFDAPMVPGRWRVELDMPTGFLVRELVVNRESLDGPAALLDTSSDRRPQWVTWRVSAPAEVNGQVIEASGLGAPGVTVVATPIAPGDWVESEARRGRRHDRVAAHVRRVDRYRMGLPPGRWRLEPVGDDLVSAEPPSVEVDLAAGQQVRQDFTVELGSADEDGVKLIVQVEPGEGAPDVDDAVVAVWEAGQVGSAPPLRRGRVEQHGRRRLPWAHAEFPGMRIGRYEVVAGQRDTLDGTASVEIVEADVAEGWKRVTVRLPRAAELHVAAFAADDRAEERGVELGLERLGEPPPSPLDDETLVRARMRQVERTDATGRAAMPGLWPGTYRLDARVTGELARRRFARVADAGSDDLVDALEVVVVDTERLDADAVVFDGATIEGVLRCDDGGPLPQAASFRVYRTPGATSPPGPGAAEPSRSDPELALDDVALAGRDQDEFVLGPLRRGSHVAAVRPIGHRAWAWLYGTDLVEDAAILDVRDGESVGVGAVEAACAPRIVVQPQIADGADAPDLRDGRASVAVATRNAAGDPVAVDPRVELRRDHVMTTGLVEGEAGLRVDLRHPYLVPAHATVEREGVILERGRIERIAVPFRTVGGAIRVAGTDAPVCLWDRAGEARERSDSPPAGDGPRLVGIPAGAYRVGRCAAGREAAREVAVEAGVTVTVDLGP